MIIFYSKKGLQNSGSVFYTLTILAGISLYHGVVVMTSYVLSSISYWCQRGQEFT